MQGLRISSKTYFYGVEDNRVSAISSWVLVQSESSMSLVLLCNSKGKKVKANEISIEPKQKCFEAKIKSNFQVPESRGPWCLGG